VLPSGLVFVTTPDADCWMVLPSVLVWVSVPEGVCVIVTPSFPFQVNWSVLCPRVSIS
jgi:hypothetical protein